MILGLNPTAIEFIPASPLPKYISEHQAHFLAKLQMYHQAAYQTVYQMYHQAAYQTVYQVTDQAAYEVTDQAKERTVIAVVAVILSSDRRRIFEYISGRADKGYTVVSSSNTRRNFERTFIEFLKQPGSIIGYDKKIQDIDSLYKLMRVVRSVQIICNCTVKVQLIIPSQVSSSNTFGSFVQKLPGALITNAFCSTTSDTIANLFTEVDAKKIMAPSLDEIESAINSIIKVKSTVDAL